MKARSFLPNTYDANLVKRHDDNSAINKKGAGCSWAVRPPASARPSSIPWWNAPGHGHNPEAYLSDVLQRLPAMTTQDDLGALLPSRWQPAAAAGPVVDVEATVCLS